MVYEDNPLANLEYLKTLNSDELKMYIRGYLLACTHVREAFNKGKLDLLSSFMLTENRRIKNGLLKSIKLLDNYETVIKGKETTLLRLFPDLFKK